MLAAGCGTIDLIGTPGAENYFQQIVWGIRKKPYIGVRPVTHSKETPVKSRWRFTDAVANWNRQGCEGSKADIEVFSDADTISLYLNGKRIGRKKVKDYRACFCTK